MNGRGELSEIVDTVWNQLWVAGVLDPLIAVEQISYLILLRYLDATVPTLFDSYPGLRWRSLAVAPPPTVLKALRTEAVSLIADSSGPSFRWAMRGAQIVIDDPQVASDSLHAIDRIDLHRRGPAPLAAAFDLLLGQLRVPGGRGVYQTPHSLTRMMVGLLAPRPGETICDPAAGTGGLLAETVAYVRDQGGGVESVDLRGYDVNDGMVRLAAINLRLRGVPDPKVALVNALADDFAPDHKADIVVTNPPFGELTGRQQVHPALAEAGRRSELLFLELSRRLLTENGRAAVLVPQSVLFGRSNDSLGVRQRLLRHGRVDAVITVPAGAIEQYSAVKTAILLVSARGVTRRVWFLQLPELDDVPAGGLDPARFDQDVVDAVRSKAFNMPTPTGRAATLAEGMWQASIDEISDRNWTLLPSTYLVPELAAREPEDPLELLAQIEEGQTEIGERLALARRLLEEA